MKHSRIVFLSLIAVVFGLVAQAAPPLPGAIFTTTSDGSVVNGNTKYESKCEVYLDGGPGINAPAGAAGLPPGDYYFQVTDPSGKKLLSTDPVANRRITVSADGVIVAHSGSHPTGVDVDHSELGAITIQLGDETCPDDYLDTPNNGGVYKAWITPVGDGTINGGGFVGDPSLADNPCGNGCFHGFIPARSKTDNFKVGDKEETFCIQVNKWIEDKINLPGVGWEITITDALGVSNMHYTDSDGSLEVCGLTAGTYTVTEALEDSLGFPYEVVSATVNGQDVGATGTVTIMWTKGKEDPQAVSFLNRDCPKCGN